MHRSKILFLATHRLGRAPGQRFRFEQYLKFLNEEGFDYEFSYLFDEKQDIVFYSRGQYLKKAFILLQCFFKRVKDILNIKKFDVVFVQREAMIFGPPVFEWIISKLKTKIIFDFDDSIWLSNVSEHNRYFSWLKFPDKTKRIVKMASTVYAGNLFLKNYALQFNRNVQVIPTTIDTAIYNVVDHPKYDKKRICIGWSGSITTIQHFKLLEPVLYRLKSEYQDGIYFKVIGDEKYCNEQLGIKGIKWSDLTEIEDLSEIEIGVMPLPDNEWAKGKCGLKGLQYMALGIATIMSPVGVNSEIIDDGQNGYLAYSEEEWYEKIAHLVKNRAFSKEMGMKGRETVLEKYSTLAQKENFINGFKQIKNLK